MSDENQTGPIIRNEFASLKMSGEDIDKVGLLRAAFSDVASKVESLCPQGRYQSIVHTKLEEAAMFATKAISHK